MNPREKFEKEREERIRKQGADKKLAASAETLMQDSIRSLYSYNFSWLGRPVIQYPQDMIAVQEIIWQVKPDLIVETGIAHGGSLIMSASLLATLDYCESVESGAMLDPRAARRRVLGIDIDIRSHNRAAIQSHPMSHRIDMIQGSSISPEIIQQVNAYARDYRRVMVFLDSNHTHEHVLAELEAYAPLTSQGSYCVVFDTIIEDLPEDIYHDRPWSKGNNPKTAVLEYLSKLERTEQTASDGAELNFEIDSMIENKFLLTVAPSGYLRRL